MLEVVEPGLLTTVQDRGRPAAAAWGVPAGGACDTWSLAVANALAGNPADAAALEMTLAGPTLRALADTHVGLAGADLEARLDDEDEHLPPGTARLLRRGQTLTFGVATGGAGVRAYLALHGGIDVAPVLGSRSTCLIGGFGGLAGRRLAAGDVVVAGSPSRPMAHSTRWPTDGFDPALEATRRPLRVLPGPDVDRLVRGAFDRFVESDYRVSVRADRQALVLDGPPLPVGPTGGVMLSAGVVGGAVQLPPDGLPICLLADHQTVGGYPVVAVVITANLPLLGQLGPTDPVRFAAVDAAEAVQALLDRRRAWQDGIAQLAGRT
jgi:5-oxoprolinase (ATP-hydrolysing) subunit C